MLSARTEVLFATSTIDDGNMSFRFDTPEAVCENRSRFLTAHNIGWDEHICMHCDHTEQIAIASKNSPGIGARTRNDMPTAEVLVTNEPGLALMVLTADCIPAAFYDPVRKVIALAHLNRKTIAFDLAQKTVGFLREHYGTNPADLFVHFGPHVHPASYTFLLPLTEPTPLQLAPYCHITGEQVKVDFPQAHFDQLVATGVSPDHISISPIDVATDPRYFSWSQYRKGNEQKLGINASVLMLQ